MDAWFVIPLQPPVHLFGKDYMPEQFLQMNADTEPAIVFQ